MLTFWSSSSRCFRRYFIAPRSSKTRFSSRALFKKCKASSSLSSKNFSVVFFLPLFLHRLTTTISAARKSASRISSLREGISRKGPFLPQKKRKKSALSLSVCKNPYRQTRNALLWLSRARGNERKSTREETKSDETLLRLRPRCSRGDDTLLASFLRRFLLCVFWIIGRQRSLLDEVFGPTGGDARRCRSVSARGRPRAAWRQSRSSRLA